MLRDAYSGGVESQRLYAQRNANDDVTALVNTSGQVQERYLYDPYGSVTITDASWNPRTGNTSSFGWRYLHQGGRLDAATGWYDFRNRDLIPSEGRWAERDPLGLAAGDANIYRYVASAPANSVDPSGLIDWGDLVTRALGGLQAVGGLAEASLGASLIMAPEPTLTKVGGGILVVNGVDNYHSGMQTLLYGQPTRTVTEATVSGVAHELGMSKPNADALGVGVNAGIGVVGPMKAAQILMPPTLIPRTPLPRTPRAKPGSNCPTPETPAAAVPAVEAAAETGIAPVSRRIAGTPGEVTGGSSTTLGKNMMEAMGLPRSQKWTGYQAQHVIPSELRSHPVLQKIGMDLDNASNGMFLPTPDKALSPLSRHPRLSLRVQRSC